MTAPLSIYSGPTVSEPNLRQRPHETRCRINPGAYMMLACCAAREGQGSPALHDAADAVNRDPENWEVYYTLGLVQAAAGRQSRAALDAAHLRDPLGSYMTEASSMLDHASVRAPPNRVRVADPAGGERLWRSNPGRSGGGMRRSVAADARSRASVRPKDRERRSQSLADHASRRISGQSEGSIWSICSRGCLPNERADPLLLPQGVKCREGIRQP